MANTLLTTKEAGGLHFYIFTTASASTTESCNGPIGKSWAIGIATDSAGTATASTVKYTASTGVAAFSALTGADAYTLMLITD